MTADGWMWVLVAGSFMTYSRWAWTASRTQAELDRIREQLDDMEDRTTMLEERDQARLHTLIVRPRDTIEAGDGALWNDVLACFLAGDDVELILPADVVKRLVKP